MISWLAFQVYCVVKSVIVGTLIAEDANGSTFNVNEQLFKEGYADRVKETDDCEVWFFKYFVGLQWKLQHNRPTTTGSPETVKEIAICEETWRNQEKGITFSNNLVGNNE